MTRERIALFGGTFDPIHWGHLLLAESARVSFKLDRVIFIPTGTPPHKKPAIASPAQRLRMLRLATRSNPFFEVSDWEVRQKRVVYSYETIAHFQHVFESLPAGRQAQLFFIVGTDMLKIVDQWKKGRTLLDQCVFLAAERPDVPWGRLPAGVRHKARRIEWPSVALASHEIRNRLRRRQSIRYQVPDPVERYIRTHKVYP